MTDLDLLLLAARAAGITVIRSRLDDPLQRDMLIDLRPDAQPRGWNPLTDDGDALRLAVKLGIDLQLFRTIPQEFRTHDLFARACVDRLGRCFGEQVVDDPCAATRRAIVRAAAAIAEEQNHD